MTGLFERFKKGLAKTREALTNGFKEVFSGKTDATPIDRLTEILLGADLGLALTQRLIASLKEPIASGAGYDVCRETLKQEIKTILQNSGGRFLNRSDDGAQQGSPLVAFFGVNGVGKTTTIGKLAYRFNKAGKTVLLAAGDTFRAGAIEQLSIWGKRAGAGVIRSTEGADPSSVIFDAVKAAAARKSDYLLIDTAGRLQTNYNLMEELKKITRVITKASSHSAYERILVLDAMTGQNALSQAKQFHEAVGVTGLILTKLDTTARGGILVAVSEMLQVPVLYVGMGEGVEDIFPFDLNDYVNALL